MALVIEFISREQQHSDYDWADISDGTVRVGKARCLMEASQITIYSINIYPEWKGHGYGREFVDYCKSHFKIVIADRVRQSAIGFWKAVGFCDNHDGNWRYGDIILSANAAEAQHGPAQTESSRPSQPQQNVP